MHRTNQSLLSLATLAILPILSLQVQAQAPSGRPMTSARTNGTFHNSTSTRRAPTSTRTVPTLTDSGGFATGTSFVNAGENMSPIVMGGLVLFLGGLLAF
ncbi:hypothetical protein BOTNAR_0052g00070 [Botryotinia narcissicola]|uniref:Uncharacterized protein n=1 Tax=Botryotinia narcissicola TaxID=278944 RepID=A0A4Z1J5P7_9HELO|nr:hypothetical protein BOTNAR_0052g00070 [Botryotinia narcissicola]